MTKRQFVPVGVALLAGAALGIGSLLMVDSSRANARDPLAGTAALKNAVPSDAKEAAAPLKLANSRINHVTIYQNNALITREVDIPEGNGIMEITVSPMPAMTVNTSLYSEGTEGLRVLTTRFRLRPVKEDIREEVRKAEAQMKELQNESAKMQSDIKTLENNIQLIGNLQTFTTVSAASATEKGKLDGDQIITLADYVMKTRTEKNKELVTLQQQLQANKEQLEFATRQLRELTSGVSKVERDAIIIVDKTKAGAGKVKLNYLVDSVGWRPQYRFRAGKKDDDKTQIEYMAGVMQQTGEDWSNVSVSLSTAQPLLNAAPPDLAMLQVSLVPKGSANPVAGQFGLQGGNLGFQGGGEGRGGPGQAGNPMMPGSRGFQDEVRRYSDNLRSQSAQNFVQKKGEEGNKLVNDAAALDQANEFLWVERGDLQNRRGNRVPVREGQSVTYHLPTKLSIPSRNEEHVIEVTKIDMKPEFCYKAVPVLTPHVYRLGNFTNSSETVLLPGEASMYYGEDFVGRMDLPLVAIGEQFTAGFGVDPQLQVHREMLDKVTSQQGGNQVHKFEYRILVSSYKAKPVKVQVWDRLPRSDTETVNVTVLKTTPELCSDPLYLREKKQHNILRWDLEVKPDMNGEKAMPVNYEFKVELDRQMMIGGFISK